MAKKLKLSIKNVQIAEALGDLKTKLTQKEGEIPETETAPKGKVPAKPLPRKAPARKPGEEHPKPLSPEEAPGARVRARSRSAFASEATAQVESPAAAPTPVEISEEPSFKEEAVREPEDSDAAHRRRAAELREKIFGEAPSTEAVESVQTLPPPAKTEEVPPPPIEKKAEHPVHPVEMKQTPTSIPKLLTKPIQPRALPRGEPREKLGPTGRHINDLLAKPRAKEPKGAPKGRGPTRFEEIPAQKKEPAPLPEAKQTIVESQAAPIEELEAGKKGKGIAFKEFRDVKPRRQEAKSFDVRDRHGLREGEEETRWRKKRGPKALAPKQEETVRPTSLKVRIPISLKDLASEMKLKASELIAKMFFQGVIVTLNDLLEDETTIQLLGQEFGCDITIDTKEADRIRITDKSIKEEIKASPSENLVLRPPVVAFMGHVDHGKTSLIDAIRSSNLAAGEAGAITQHIGAFRCHTNVGDLTILDTPGHEAFSAMRARGADVTDIVVLVVAGDEGIQQQTEEAIQHARTANVSIIVALNKCDKPTFNAEHVYRQLADQNLLPEVWGGQTLTVNCSAVTKEGITQLLESIVLQSEIQELKADPTVRARGTVLESEMHKGLGAMATVLVQNGTLRLGDSLVFGQHWGRVKTMHNEFGQDISEATPSTPVAITGLSGLPPAGQEFVAVKNEREAKDIADVRQQQGIQQSALQKKTVSVEAFLQQATPSAKKILNLILRADVQGSLEALRIALEKIHSEKVSISVISASVGEISESDIELAITSKAAIIGFHTKIEAHAETLVKQFGVEVRLHDIIYHAIDDVKQLMINQLDKIAVETDKGKAEVRALFQSSQVGVIAGCIVTDGSIHRNQHIRVMRKGIQVGKAPIASLRRVKEDVREVQKGVECGIVLGKFTDIQVGDILESYEVTYVTQEL